MLRGREGALTDPDDLVENVLDNVGDTPIRTQTAGLGIVEMSQSGIIYSKK